MSHSTPPTSPSAGSSPVAPQLTKATNAANDPTQADVDKVIEAYNKADTLIAEWQQDIATLQGKLPEWTQDITNAGNSIASNQAQITSDYEQLRLELVQLSGFGSQLEDLHAEMTELETELVGASDPNTQQALQQEINEVSDEITSLEGQIKNLAVDMKQMLINISGLKGEISTAQTQIQGWNQDITEAEKIIPVLQNGITGLQTLQPKIANWLVHLPSSLQGDIYTLGDASLQTAVTHDMDNLIVTSGVEQATLSASHQILSEQKTTLTEQQKREDEIKRESKHSRQEELATANQQGEELQKTRQQRHHQEELQQQLAKQCNHLSKLPQTNHSTSESFTHSLESLQDTLIQMNKDPLSALSTKARPRFKLNS